jgi:putative peptidoglycan lipid II flippase
MTFISRIMGLVRDIVTAHVFGASAGMDAFMVAFRIPNFMRRLFAEGSFSQAFVPVLARYKEKHTEEEVREFVAGMAGTLGTVLLLLTVVVELATPLVVLIFAPGYLRDPYRFHEASTMLRITFPYLFLIAMTAFSGSLLNTYNRFAIPAFTPVLLNFAMIGTALFLAPHLANPIHALAWGVFLAGVLQLGFQLPFLKRLKLLVRPRIQWRHPGVTQVMRMMVPALFGVSVAQISVLLDTLFASFLPIGSVSWLYYSDRLTSFPLGIFGVAIATVVLPHLSKHKAREDTGEFSHIIDWGLRMVLLIGVPAGLGLLMLSGPLLASFYLSGAFSDYDVIMANKSMMMFALGVPGFMLIKILAAGFYANQDIKTPVKCAAYAVGCNILINIALIVPMRHAGLALSTSLSSLVNAILLAVLLHRKGTWHLSAHWKRYSLQLLVANAAVVALLFWLSPPLQTWMHWPKLLRVEVLLGLVFGSMALYLVVLRLAGLQFRAFLSARRVDE